MNHATYCECDACGGRRRDVKIKQLVWSEHRKACEECRYDHVVAESPIGTYRIEWKSWKEYDCPSIMLISDHCEDWIGVGHDVEDSKKIAQKHFEDVILAAR